MEALYKLDPPQQPLVDLAKTFERRRCNHRQAIPPDECLTDVVGATNKHRYVLAAQSKHLREKLDAIPGLPLIHFNPRGVLVLSPASRATLRTKDVQEEKRRLEGAGVLAGVEDGANVVGPSTTTSTSAGGSAGGGVGVKRNRVKGANPLSMKKKKTIPTEGQKREEKKAEVEQAAEVVGKSKKKRKRGKGVVKLAKEEIEAERLAAAASGVEAGGESGGESD